jgi:hypothetical protein
MLDNVYSKKVSGKAININAECCGWPVFLLKKLAAALWKGKMVRERESA